MYVKYDVVRVCFTMAVNDYIFITSFDFWKQAQ